MNKFMLSATCIAVLSLLISCSSSKDNEPIAAMPPEPPEPLTIPAGLAASEASPVYATNEGDTIVALMRNARSVFAPIASTLQRTFSGEDVGTKPGSDFHIKTVASDGSGGFNVTYVIGEEERDVHFTADDYGAEGCGDTSWCTQDEEGRGYWFWETYNDLDYANTYGASFPGGNQSYLVLGARTESDAIPSGSASWFGRMYVQSWKQDNPSRDERITLDGRIVLTADFGESVLSGRIQALRSRGDDGVYRALEDSSAHFAVANGRILNGQFVAELSGKGDATVQGDGTVRGYEGNMLGEFYGPEARELGGVVNATSESHGRVLGGDFFGTMLNATSGDKVPAISQALFVDRPGSSVTATDIAGVTNVQRDGVGGFHLTFEVDGVETPIHLAATDLGSDAAFFTGYHKRVGNHVYWLWDYSDSFYTDPEFDYMNLGLWAITNYPAGSDDFSESTSHSGFMAYGTPTDVGELPVGTASYNGRAFAQILPADDPRGSARSIYRGSLSLTADFASNSISGMIDEIEYRAPRQSSYASTNRVWNIGNGSISGNGFSADLTETGNASTAVSMTGGFYGPSAEEVGGVLSGTTAEGVVRGYFGGTK